jgi:hypothetical protein
MPAVGRSTAAFVLVMGLLAAAAGCGGDGDGAKKTYVQSANEVCARTAERVKALPQANDAPGVVAHLQQLATVMRDQATALRQLTPPPKDATVLEGMVAQIELTSANLGAAATAKNQRDESGASAALARAGAAIRNANTAARRYGLSRCGSSV